MNMRPNKCALQLIVLILALSGSPLAAQIPDAPTDLIAQASRPGDLAISLFWTDASSNEIGFEIQRSQGDGSGPFETISLGMVNNVGAFNDIGLLENTSYTYRVRAHNAAGNSAFTNLATAKTSYAMPNQVANLVGTVVGANVQLSWTDMADNETSFAVERAELGVSLAYETIASLAPDSTGYVDKTALAGAVYSYRITPWRFDVSGGAPLTVELQTGPALAALSSVSAQAKSRSSIELHWRGSFTKDVKVQVQRFDIDAGVWSTIGLVPANDRKFLSTGLKPRTSYAYRVRLVASKAVSTWTEVNAATR